jgi:hypothetical protein
MTHSSAPTGRVTRWSSHGSICSHAPAVHADLAALAALAATDQDAAGRRVQVAFGKGERLADPQAGAPQQHDERLGAQAVRGAAGAAHDRDELFDRRRIGRVPQALVAWRTTAVMARHGRRRTTTTGRVEQNGSSHACQRPRRAVPPHGKHYSVGASVRLDLA